MYQQKITNIRDDSSNPLSKQLTTKQNHTIILTQVNTLSY